MRPSIDSSARGDRDDRVASLGQIGLGGGLDLCAFPLVAGALYGVLELAGVGGGSLDQSGAGVVVELDEYGGLVEGQRCSVIAAVATGFSASVRGGLDLFGQLGHV